MQPIPDRERLLFSSGETNVCEKIMKTKDAVLNMLVNNTDKYISGEGLANELGLSRSSVWKAVEELRTEGYRIDSVTRRGYRLSPENDVLSVEGIRRELLSDHSMEKRKDAGEKVIPEIRLYRELASTNLEAIRLITEAPTAEKEKLFNTVIIAESQSAGRGHGKRRFFSPEGGLYLSVILNPESFNGRVVSLLASMAVADIVEELSGETTSFLWKNNILIGGKKTAGILTEQSMDLETGIVNGLVLGIGIRTDEWLKKGGNMKNRLAAALVRKSLGNWKNLPLDDYEKKLAGTGEKHTFISAEYNDGKPFTARQEAYVKDGRLRIRPEDGHVITLDRGSILC